MQSKVIKPGKLYRIDYIEYYNHLKDKNKEAYIVAYTKEFFEHSPETLFSWRGLDLPFFQELPIKKIQNIGCVLKEVKLPQAIKDLYSYMEIECVKVLFVNQVICVPQKDILEEIECQTEIIHLQKQQDS